MNIITDLKNILNIDPNRYLEYEGFAEGMFYKLGGNYILLLSSWGTAYSYTALIYADSIKILSFYEYDYRTPREVFVESNNIFRINYGYGCCDGRYEVVTFYDYSETDLVELPTLLLSVEPVHFYHENEKDYSFFITSDHKIQSEKSNRYKKNTIHSNYRIIKYPSDKSIRLNKINENQFAEYWIKYEIDMILMDSFVFNVESDDTEMLNLFACYYDIPQMNKESCFKIFERDDYPMASKSINSQWKKFIGYGDPIDPFLIIIKSLPLAEITDTN